MATNESEPVPVEPDFAITPETPAAAAPTSAAAPAPAPAPTAPARKRSWGNAYTWMLVLSLMFLTIGCLILLREWSMYGFEYKPV